MGKNNRRRLATSSSTKRSKPSSTLKSTSKPTGITKSSKKPGESKKELTKQQLASLSHALAHPTLPFTPHEKLLLIGEGDLSFARSLVEEHGCEDVTATVFESEGDLRRKYPQAGENIDAIVGSGGGVVKYGVDATRMKPFRAVAGEGKNGRLMGEMDRVFFNFPHVGGKTKDVNRQVRYNQELLVAFFRTAIPSLSPTRGSSIIVTLFEGEPYTLWNIRDLGRHAGLQLDQSFKFQASAYPGYKHSRTLGVVKGDGGWKGEERKARSYVFVRKDEGSLPNHAQVVQEKKKKVESSDEEEEDDGEGIFDESEREGEEVVDGHDAEIKEDEGFRQG